MLDEPSEKHPLSFCVSHKISQIRQFPHEAEKSKASTYQDFLASLVPPSAL